MTETHILTPTVAVVGAGPAGLSAAMRLASAVGEVLVLEREREAGGIPRHSDHLGYGIRDRTRFMSGPAYARALVSDAVDAGARIMTRAAVTGWDGEGGLLVTTPQGRVRIRPQAILMATGARERPRSARMIPGTRPAGVFTTGQVQNLIHLHREKVGERAVVVGAELVSWSAVSTLAASGCRTEALISAHPRGESYGVFRVVGQGLFRTRIETDTTVVAIRGRSRVSGVEVEHTPTGQRRVIACDTVVFTGDWVPDNELLCMAGVEVDRVSLSPVVDAAMRTSVDGIFSVGNLNHPVETADVVALEGKYAAERIVEHLRGAAWPVALVPIKVNDPLRWISPSRWEPGAATPARGRLVAWVDRYVGRPLVTVMQQGRQLARRRLVWPAAPGRAFRIPAALLRDVSASGGEVTIALE